MLRCFTTTTTTVLRLFFRDHPGEPVPEENFWTLWCKGRLTEADTLTVRLGATPSRLTSAHLHHPQHSFNGLQQCQSFTIINIWQTYHVQKNVKRVGIQDGISSIKGLLVTQERKMLTGDFSWVEFQHLEFSAVLWHYLLHDSKTIQQ